MFQLVDFDNSVTTYGDVAKKYRINFQQLVDMNTKENEEKYQPLTVDAKGGRSMGLGAGSSNNSDTEDNSELVQQNPDQGERADDPIYQRVTNNDQLQDMLLKYGYTFDEDDIKGIRIRDDAPDQQQPQSWQYIDNNISLEIFTRLCRLTEQTSPIQRWPLRSRYISWHVKGSDIKVYWSADE